MKLTKIFALALAVAAFTSCDDEPKAEDFPNFLGAVNTQSGVTVSLPATFSANENEQPFYIPVTVTGETNGKVVVAVEVKELTTTPEGTEPAKQVEHFNLTSGIVNIPAGENTGELEIYPVWVTGEINDDRVFDITVTHAEGATVSNATCRVTIVNIDDPYTSMCGKWTMTATNMSTGDEAQWVLNVKTPDPASDSYGSLLMAFGFGGESDYFIPLTNFQYDEATETGTVEIGYGYLMSLDFFNYGLPDYAAPVCYFRSGNSITFNHTSVCQFDGNYNSLSIPSDANIYGGLLYESDFSFSGYGIGWYGNFKMSRR